MAHYTCPYCDGTEETNLSAAYHACDKIKVQVKIETLSTQNAALLAALEGTFPLAIAHAAVYQVTNELPDLHPTHGEIIQNAKTAIAAVKGEK